MFRFHWNHHRALLQKYIDPLRRSFPCKDLYIFIEGPDDDSNGIETCSPSPINNILMTVVFEQYCIFCIRARYGYRNNQFHRTA
jgi:hypothetical protein